MADNMYDERYFGKGIVFKSVDGGEHASMEAVEQANKAYWDRMKIDHHTKIMLVMLN